AEQRNVPQKSVAQLNAARTNPTVPIAAVRVPDYQVTAQNSIEPVGGRGDVHHQIMQVRVRHMATQPEVRFLWNAAISEYIALEFAPVKVRLQVRNGNHLVRPPDRAADLRHVEFPVMEGPAGEFESHIRSFTTPNLRPAIYMRGRRRHKSVGA